MKKLEFVGDSRDLLRAFPSSARRNAGVALQSVQRGEEPRDSKPLIGVGMGACELRLWSAEGTFRVVYAARFSEAVYVLHAFQKKTERTSMRDLELARRRYEEVSQRRSDR